MSAIAGLPWLALGLLACGTDSNLAGGVVITDVTLYQGPEIPLIRKAELVTTRDAPVLANRGGRLSVKLQMPYGADAREITVRVEVSDVLTGETATVERPVAFAFGAGNAEVDLEFEPALLPSANVMFSIAAVEQPGFTSVNDVLLGARLPETGVLPLGARDARTFRVVALPTGPNPPVIGNARLDRWRAVLASWLPVADVDISVAEPMPVERDLSKNSGWDSLLGDVAAWRAAQSFDPEVYAIGVVAPDPTAPLLGIAASLSIENPYWRVVTLQLQPQDDEAEGALVAHELGHALGRSHVACGNPGGPDFAYPYEEGSIGVPGLDLRDRVLRMPDEHVDFMSYCAPAFISDYGFAQLYRGLSALDDRAAIPQGEPSFIRDPVRSAGRLP